MSEIDNRKYILASIETAFLANGGREHDTKNCQCDASVGMCPCQYCAIHFALEQSETFIKATVQQDAELSRLHEELAKAKEKLAIIQDKLCISPWWMIKSMTRSKDGATITFHKEAVK